MASFRDRGTLPAMGLRGPKRQATTLHRLRGSYRPDCRGHGEPEAPGEPVPPAALKTAAEKRRFRELVAILLKGVVRRCDSMVVANLSILQERLAAVWAEIRAHGELSALDLKSQTLLNRELKIIAAMKPLIGQLGCAPGSRANLRHLQPEPSIDKEAQRWYRVLELSRRSPAAIAATSGAYPEVDGTDADPFDTPPATKQ